MKKLIVLLATNVPITAAYAETLTGQSDSMIYIRGDKLIVENGAFRFIGFNIPCPQSAEE
jgi:hypothetical protein